MSVREIRRARERIRVLWSAGMRWFQNPGRAQGRYADVVESRARVLLGNETFFLSRTKLKNSLAERDDFGSCKTTIVAPFFTTASMCSGSRSSPYMYIKVFISHRCILNFFYVYVSLCLFERLSVSPLLRRPARCCSSSGQNNPNN